MFAAFGFEAIGVVVGDMYFVDPTPLEGQETPERGVRLELRLVDRAEPRGSIYAGIPIAFTRPVWRGGTFSCTAGPTRWLDPPPDPGSSAPTCQPTRCLGWPISWPTWLPCWPGQASMPMRSPEPMRSGSRRQPRRVAAA